MKSIVRCVVFAAACLVAAGVAAANSWIPVSPSLWSLAGLPADPASWLKSFMDSGMLEQEPYIWLSAATLMIAAGCRRDRA